MLDNDLIASYRTNLLENELTRAHKGLRPYVPRTQVGVRCGALPRNDTSNRGRLARAGATHGACQAAGGWSCRGIIGALRQKQEQLKTRKKKVAY